MAREGLARSLAAIDLLSGSSDSIFEIASARRSPDSNDLVNVKYLTGVQEEVRGDPPKPHSPRRGWAGA